MKIQIVENVLKLNDEVAAANRARLAQGRVFTVDLMGAPGAGKTALLEATLKRLPASTRAAVIVGDLATARDGQRLQACCRQVVQVNTGKTCHLEAHHVARALQRLNLDRIDLLIIENVGNLICPVGFDLGQGAKVGLFSVTEGDDKAAKHPFLVRESDLLVLNKVDLLPYVKFDSGVFRRDVARLRPHARLIETSVTTGQGLDLWINWLLGCCATLRTRGRSGGPVAIGRGRPRKTRPARKDAAL